MLPFSEFGVAIVEHHIATSLMSIRVDPLKGIPLAEAGSWPPKAAAPGTVGFGHRIPHHAIIGRASHIGALEVGLGRDIKTLDFNGASSVRMDP